MDLYDCTQSFVLVVDLGSFSAAASHLGTTSSAVSKRIRWLEQRIGATLLKRTTRSLTLTETGQLYYQRGQKLLEEWNSLIDEAGSRNAHAVGVLRVGASLALASRILIYFIEEFLRLYPQIKVELYTVTPKQLPDHNLDVFLSAWLEGYDTLSYIGKPLFDFQFGFFAAPSYIARHGEPTNASQIEQHNCLLFREYGHSEEREFCDGSRISLSGNFVTRNSEALINGAVAGMGLLLGTEMTISRELNEGLLVPVLPALKLPKNTIYAYYPKLGFESTKTRLFIDFIKDKASHTL
ncbi:LysR family transcriptional regulator [Motiliproteus sp. MSK22-1]|uniref:LysR family transcriptional regulator n=1 Tax=Motiliproteus sp. MSK22-1 TaxID=1897630 RepID=UPI0009756C40|nr:LysR family transcriptional regulator [Motiliproteus sp. MSK22-1]OMH27137.1 LysR family transcriptional regulator [Motiliproteus sp. MSK22-1]